MSGNIPKVYEDRLLDITKGPEKTIIIEKDDETGKLTEKTVKAEKTDKFGTVVQKRDTMYSSKPRKNGHIDTDRGEDGTVRETFA